MRLQKYLASCGVASRRAAEKLMAEGHVTVDGQVVSQMGAQVEPGQDVRVDGRPVRPEAEKRYIMYHKPAGEVTTVTDPEGRATVLDKFRDFPVRLRKRHHILRCGCDETNRDPGEERKRQRAWRWRLY